MAQRSRSDKKTINLALQGGGAHGALTWGVLDRLLEEERLEIEGISATSAGAMNAAVAKCGLLSGGRQAAIDRLDAFWSNVLRLAELSDPLSGWLQSAFDIPSPFAAAQARLAHAQGEAITRALSPYDFNPTGFHPLRDLLGQLDFETVCGGSGPKLFISATNVRSGKIKIFEGAEISTDAILASACLPTLFQAIEIEDPETGRLEAYWDGGYVGNPALFPLFYETRSRDILIVHINPIEREDVPRRPADILNRVNEVSFNSSLLRELRGIEFVKRLIAEGRLTGENGYKDVLIHSIRDDATMAQYGVATKMRPERETMQTLRQTGRDAADAFLTAHWSDLSNRSTVDLRAMFS